MAEVSDTAAAQCTGEQGFNTDINTWLTKHRLNKFKQYFEENEVIIEDLLTYNEDEMNSVINECQITATAYKKRFKDSIRQLQFERNKGNIKTSSSSSQIYRVVMSTKESEAMDQLKAKLVEINKLSKENKNKTNKISNNTKHIENDIKSLFSEIRKQMDEREKALMLKLNDISDDYSNKLKNQKNCLDEYQKSIETAMKEQNSLLLDPVMESKKRQIKIEHITNNAVNNIDGNKTKLVLAEIRFIADNKAINEYISSIGTLTNQPDAPILKVTEIGRIEAKVTMECKVNDDNIQYHLKYKTIGNDGDEKKSNWTEVDIDNNKNEYVLKTLKKDTKYKICGKYQTSKDRLWSIYSTYLVFKTLDYNETHDWDVNCKSSKLSVNGNIVTVVKQGWSTIWLKEIVSNGKHEWRFKIIKNIEKYQDFGFGVTNENDTKNKNAMLGKCVCFMVKDKTQILLYTETGAEKHYMARAKENDVVTMIADFNTKQLTFMINGNNVGEAVTFKAGHYRAAASLYYQNNAIKLL